MCSVVPQDNVDIVDGSTSQLEGENVSVKARKAKVTEALLSLGIQVPEGSDPPVIAVLGSGGGLRAMIGFLGTLSKLSELNLLDLVTYVGGTSGSTWCMSSLYSNEENWTDFSCMKDLESRLCEQIKCETKRDWKEPSQKIKKRFMGKLYSLTDFWAYAVVFKILNNINEGNLSDHKTGCENGKNPYPIYSAVEKDHLNKNDLGTWFEFTPHLSGFPAYKAYVKSDHLGSVFEEGRLLESRPQKELSYLQGMWGSALGDTVPHLLLRFLYGVLHELMSYLHEEVSSTCKACEKIKEILLHPLKMLEEEVEDFWHKLVKRLEEALENTTGRSHGDLATLESFLNAETKQIDSVQGGCEIAAVIKNILYCIAHWKWGTTNNFLYQWKPETPDSEEPEILAKKHICLIDAGLEINTPFPLILLPHRKVDLILSFDFSEGDPFETLTQTRNYCEKNKVPFPNINIDDKGIPSKSCYSFGGDGGKKPYVMHFPQFNTETCEDEKKVKELRKTYETFVPSYEEVQLKNLLDIAKKNVESNKDQIVEKIKHCVGVTEP